MSTITLTPSSSSSSSSLSLWPCQWTHPPLLSIESTHLANHHWIKLKQSLIPYPSSLLSRQCSMTTPMIVLTGHSGQASTWYPAVAATTTETGTGTIVVPSSPSLNNYYYQWPLSWLSTGSSSQRHRNVFTFSLCRPPSSYDGHITTLMTASTSISIKGHLSIASRLAIAIGCSEQQYRYIINRSSSRSGTKTTSVVAGELSRLLDDHVLCSIVVDNGNALLISYHAADRYHYEKNLEYKYGQMLWKLPNHNCCMGSSTHRWPYSTTSSAITSKTQVVEMSTEEAFQWCGTVMWDRSLLNEHENESDTTTATVGSRELRVMNDQLIIIGESSTSSFIVRRLHDGHDIELALIPLPTNEQDNEEQDEFDNSSYAIYMGHGNSSNNGNDENDVGVGIDPTKVMCANPFHTLIYNMMDILTAPRPSSTTAITSSSTSPERKTFRLTSEDKKAYYEHPSYRICPIEIKTVGFIGKRSMVRHLIGGSHWLGDKDLMTGEWCLWDHNGRSINRWYDIGDVYIHVYSDNRIASTNHLFPQPGEENESMKYQTNDNGIWMVQVNPREYGADIHPCQLQQHDDEGALYLYSIASVIAGVIGTAVPSSSYRGSIGEITIPRNAHVQWMDDHTFVVADFRTSNMTIYGLSLHSSSAPLSLLVSSKDMMINKLYRLSFGPRLITDVPLIRLNVIPPQYNYDAIDAIIEWVTVTLINDAHWISIDLISIVLSYLLS
jgi:hypothetical protein